MNVEKIQQESGGGDEFIELEEVNEHFKHVVQQACDQNHETESESPPIPSSFPPSTPLTEESTQNVPPQVSMNLVFGQSNETYVPVENTAPRYPQRLNRGVKKNSMNLILKPRPNTQLITMCHLIG